MNAISTQFPELPTPAAVLERTWRATWFVGESKLDHGIEQHAVYTADQMHQYARDYAAMLAAAPTASVSERARALLAAEYRSHGWHEDAGRLCMGGDPTSFVEDDALRVIDRLIEQGDEDAHVITELGRLLASIAVILKGPEPAGTAWSYHDLPSLVASEVAEPRQVAAEMKAWAHTKMAEQQSSRRDRMMVVEWAKRLLPESSFPVKDFDVEGMSITKEAAREAVKRVALEQALTQQRGEQLGDFQDKAMAWDAVCDALGSVSPMWSRNGETGLLAAVNTIRSLATTTPQPSADAVREIYDAAAKGFHTSETNGAERKYLHVIRFQSIEDLHGYEDAWTAAMVKARDAK